MANSLLKERRCIMNSLSSIRTMKDLEYQRALLQQKAANEEQIIRRDIDVVKEDYMPIVRGVDTLRSRLAAVKAVVPVVWPVIKFLFSLRRKRSKR